MNETYYKGIIGKITISQSTGHFSIYPLYNSMVKKIRSHNMTMLYGNMFYDKVCYKGTARYFYQTIMIIFLFLYERFCCYSQWKLKLLSIYNAVQSYGLQT